MTAKCFEYNVKNVKKTVNVKNSQVMAVNIKYPIFEKNANSGLSPSFYDKINGFYRKTSDKYEKYITEKYAAKAAKIFNTNGNIKLSFLMDFTISHMTENLISVFCDLTYFNGKTPKTVRFSQNWVPEKNAVLPASAFLTLYICGFFSSSSSSGEYKIATPTFGVGSS